MAKTQAVLPATTTGPQLQVVKKRDAETIDLIRGLERFLLKIACPSHSWGWPKSIKSDGIELFESHQTCSKCASERLFDSRCWKAGPLYRHKVKSRKDHSARGQKIANYAHSPSDGPRLCVKQ